METNNIPRGGKRQGSGRKANDRHNVIFARVNDRAYQIAKAQSNVSEWLQGLILATDKKEGNQQEDN